MKKKIAALCMVSVLLAGCGRELPKMTDEEVSLVGEYAAILLLKYDANSRSRLVDLALQEEVPGGAEEQPATEPEVTEPAQGSLEVVPNTPVAEPVTEVTTDNMEGFFGLPEGIQLIYIGNDVCQSYSGGAGDFFSIDASAGKSFLVLHFMLTNNSGAEQTIDFLTRRDSYRVTVGGGYTRTALTTMLTNDMATYRGTLASGSGQELVLLVEIEQAQTVDLSSLTLNLKNEAQSSTIRLL